MNHWPKKSRYRRIYRFLTFSLSFLSFIATLFAEGTKQLAPNPADRVYLYTNSSTYNDFCRYDGNPDQRLYIHIANPDLEQVYLGFSTPVDSGHHPCNGSSPIEAYFRIKDPTGRVVYPIQGNPNGQLLNESTANITTYNQTVAGPQPIVGSTGYTPFVFDPSGLSAGDYYIEFSRTSNTVSLNNPVPIEWFDITVASKTDNPVAIEGRLFARNWALFTPSLSCGVNPTYTWFDRPFNGQFYVYTDQNIVTAVNFNGAGFQPAAFNAVFNDAGTTRIGNVIEDRKSIENSRTVAAQHRIFLNDPDFSIYPSGMLGEFFVKPIFITCENGSACVEVALTEPGQIDVLIDLDRRSGDFIYDIDSKDVLIAFQVKPELGEAPPYTRCIPWDGRDGFGEKVGDIKAIQTSSLLTRYTQGIYHFPIFDAEYMLTGFDITTIRPIPNNGSPKKIYYDDSNITTSYGAGVTQPKQESFNGCSTPCHKWLNKDFGNNNTINTWFFAREEYELQLELGNCPITPINDTTIMFVNTDTTVQVLVNDLGTENIDTTSIALGVSPVNGLAVFDTINLIANYTPNKGFIGQDSFTYVFCYGVLPLRNLCDSATVHIKVEPVKENCLNTYDDDGDGLIDCDDPDCLPSKPITIFRKRQ